LVEVEEECERIKNCCYDDYIFLSFVI